MLYEVITINDAYTNTMRYKVSNKYIDSLIRINKRKLNTYSFIQKGTKYLLNRYLATETIEDTTYLMYNDINVLRRL